MSFREREGREKRDHRSSYIGIRNGFVWGVEAKFENIIVGRRDVLSRHKGAEEVEGCRRWGGGGQCILSGDIFTEWEHELAANGMNV